MKPVHLGALAIALAGAACASNPWQTSDVNRLISASHRFQQSTSRPAIIAGHQGQPDETSLRGKGYVLIGVARVKGETATRSQIQQQARQVNASVVILSLDDGPSLRVTPGSPGEAPVRSGRPWSALSPCVDRDIRTTNDQYTECQPIGPPMFVPASGSNESLPQMDVFHFQTAAFWGKPAA